MKMFNLSFDNDGHHYAFGRYDRVSIESTAYKISRSIALGHNEQGWVLELADGSGCCHDFTHEKLSRLGSMGHIRVERNYYAPETTQFRLTTAGALISELDRAPAARLTKKQAYVEAFLELYQEKLIKKTDESIIANWDRLRSRAMNYARGLLGGTNLAVSQDLNSTPSPRTLRRWLDDYRHYGAHGLIDVMSRRGNRNRLMGPEELALMTREVQGYASEKRPTMKTIHENVCIAINNRNQDRKAQNMRPYLLPSYETVRGAIHKLDPYQVTLLREGEEAARKRFAPVGKGLRLTRPLERIEIDENTIDVMSLAESAGLLALLTEEERTILGLDKSKARWFLTVAICATTRCILGLVFSRSAQEAASLQVLQMILRDKGKWADTTGSLGAWDMHGTPALIVTDNGSAFKSQKFRAACADLGITTLRAPAALPEIRARNERFFHSLTTGLHPRLPGRTFSSIRERGNSDPEKTAALTFDDLAFCLVRWIVDIYHNTPHAGLGGETPLRCWRRLNAEWGVQPPPTQKDRRVIFGQSLPRKLSREGVTVLGVRYHSDALARWMTTREERNVELRWHPDDIGEVTVYIGQERFEARAVHSGFDGVSAREWIAARRELNGAAPQRNAHDRQIVLHAIQAIRDRSTAATRLAGLIADDWSPKRIQQEEDRLFIGFHISSDKPHPRTASDGLGVVISDQDDLDQASPQDMPQPPVIAPALGASNDVPGKTSTPQPWKITE